MIITLRHQGELIAILRSKPLYIPFVIEPFKRELTERLRDGINIPASIAWASQVNVAPSEESDTLIYKIAKFYEYSLHFDIEVEVDN